MKNEKIRESKIGALSVMPYFKLGDPGQTSDIDSQDFMTKTKSALTYYAREEFKDLYDAIYYIADPDAQTTGYENNEKKQDNKAHLVELLGAMSIFHFAEQESFSDDGVHEYCLSEDTDKVTFSNIGESSKRKLAQNLTALHLLSKLHPVTKEKANSLPYCKSNGFNSDFFESDFFNGLETGLDKFFKQYFNPWISELNVNQRGFTPFNLKVGSSFNALVNGYSKEKKALDGLIIQPVDISDLMLKMAEATNNALVKKIDDTNKYSRYLTMNWNATNDFVSSKIKILENNEQL
jgi:hypothetical protein